MEEPSASLSSRKRASYTLEDKLHILDRLSASSLPLLAFSKQVGINQSLITKWKSNEAQLRQYAAKFTGKGKELKKRRSPKYPLIEDALYQWFISSKQTSAPCTDAVLKGKASEFAQLFGIEGFQASNGWLSRFKDRHKGVVFHHNDYFYVEFIGALSSITSFLRHEKNFTSCRNEK